eukprot:3939423-Rhodomonas_salina.4
MPSVPASDTVFAGHMKHTDPAVSFRYVPAAHAVHDPDPFTGLYDPTEQAWHAAPSDPAYPMSQTQSVIASDPSIESVFSGQPTQTVPPVTFMYLPASQTVHADEPVTFLNFPLSQAVQLPPSGPVNPTSQTHASTVSLPAVEFELLGQAMQAVPALMLRVIKSRYSASPIQVTAGSTPSQGTDVPV